MTNDKTRILLKIKELIDESSDNDFTRFWTNKLNSLIPIINSDPSKFFANIKHLRGTGQHIIGTYLTINNNTITDPRAQAEAFADTWENTYNNHDPNIHNIHAINNHNTVRNWIYNNLNLINPHNDINLNRLDKQSLLLKPIHHLTVRGEINIIKSSANGPSGINGKILKHLDNKSILHLTCIYNAYLSTGYFPRPLKQGNTYLIPKPHNHKTTDQSYF